MPQWLGFANKARERSVKNACRNGCYRIGGVSICQCGTRRRPVAASSVRREQRARPVLIHSMRVRRVVAATAACCLALLGVLALPPDARSAIRLGVSIGPVRLGMTEQQVRRSLGRPDSVRRARAGRIYIVSLNYYLRGEYRVTLRGPRGAIRVSLIGTISRRQRTPEGLGIGSSERKLREAYPTLRCKDVRARSGGVIRRECRVGALTRRHTVFVIGRGANAPVAGEILVVAGST
jgi:hypothetical protein